MACWGPETTSPTTPRPSRKVSTMPAPEMSPDKYEELLKQVPEMPDGVRVFGFRVLVHKCCEKNCDDSLFGWCFS